MSVRLTSKEKRGKRGREREKMSKEIKRTKNIFFLKLLLYSCQKKSSIHMPFVHVVSFSSCPSFHWRFWWVCYPSFSFLLFLFLLPHFLAFSAIRLLFSLRLFWFRLLPFLPLFSFLLLLPFSSLCFLLFSQVLLFCFPQTSDGNVTAQQQNPGMRERRREKGERRRKGERRGEKRERRKRSD